MVLAVKHAQSMPQAKRNILEYYSDYSAVVLAWYLVIPPSAVFIFSEPPVSCCAPSKTAGSLFRKAQGLGSLPAPTLLISSRKPDLITARP